MPAIRSQSAASGTTPLPFRAARRMAHIATGLTITTGIVYLLPLSLGHPGRNAAPMTWARWTFTYNLLGALLLTTLGAWLLTGIAHVIYRLSTRPSRR